MKNFGFTCLGILIGGFIVFYTLIFFGKSPGQIEESYDIALSYGGENSLTVQQISHCSYLIRTEDFSAIKQLKNSKPILDCYTSYLLGKENE